MPQRCFAKSNFERREQLQNLIHVFKKDHIKIATKKTKNPPKKFKNAPTVLPLKKYKNTPKNTKYPLKITQIVCII